LGNTSERENQKVMNCPEGEMFVCKKMYGGGMGDQIRRYCEEVKANVMTFLYYNNKTILYYITHI